MFTISWHILDKLGISLGSVLKNKTVRNIFVGASTALGKARIFANRSAVLVVGAETL